MRDSKNSSRKRPPARTPEERANQLLGLAMDLAEKQLRDGTASASVITQVLKFENDRLQRAKLEEELELLKAKTEHINAETDIAQLYRDAMAAMKTYSGDTEEDVDDSDVY